MTNLAIPGIQEFWPILIIVLVLFGAKKLPELASAMGKSITQFKRGLKDEDKDPDRLSEAGGPDPKGAGASAGGGADAEQAEK